MDAQTAVELPLGIGINAQSPLHVIKGSAGVTLVGFDLSSRDSKHTLSDLLEDATLGQGITATAHNAQGEEIAVTDNLRTGVLVRFNKGEEVLLETTVVVKGDVLGTGQMSLAQLVRTAQAFTGSDPLSGAFLDAGDLGGTPGIIDLTDLVRMAAMFRESGL